MNNIYDGATPILAVAQFGGLQSVVFSAAAGTWWVESHTDVVELYRFFTIAPDGGQGVECVPFYDEEVKCAGFVSLRFYADKLKEAENGKEEH
jgi:hypothetical protein